MLNQKRGGTNSRYIETREQHLPTPMEIRLNDMRKQSLMQFTSKRARKYPRLTDLIIIGMRDKGVNIHFPVSHMIFLPSTSLHNRRYVGRSLKVKPMRNNDTSILNRYILVRSFERRDERGAAARNSLPPSFTLSFFPFSTGPRAGCFWIQRAERRNQRSSVCADDSLDNQLVSKLPDGRRTKLKILPLPSLPVHAVRPLLPSRENSRGQFSKNTREEIFRVSHISWRESIIAFNLLFQWFELVFKFLKDDKCDNCDKIFVVPLFWHVIKISSKLLTTSLKKLVYKREWDIRIFKLATFHD